MLEKDIAYSKLKNERLLERHPSLVESYRTILFDWLSEVSYECKFHRETYHLALDFIDRYLYAQSNVGKLQLQLIGTTCLFLAAKIEEIRPPTVNEFADLTDGACKAEDIIENEVVILSAINWDMTPMTPNNWLNLYMQILINLDKENDNNQLNQRPTASSNVSDENSQSMDSSSFPFNTSKNDAFILPTNNGVLISCHRRIASVIDLALLHIQSLRFSNSILTASALYHFTDEMTVRQCTGYDYGEIAECIDWLTPFVETIKEIRKPIFMASCGGTSHSTQMHVHVATAKLLERVIQKIEAHEAAHIALANSPCRGLKRKSQVLHEDEISNTELDLLSLSPTKHNFLPTPPHSAEKRRPRPVH